MRLIIFSIVILCFYFCKSDHQAEQSASNGTNPTAVDVQTDTKIQHTDVMGAEKLISDHSDLIILDVRSPEEYSQGSLPNAINIDVRAADFNNRLDAMDQSKPYLVHCQSGKRSMTASEIMTKSGFKNVTNLDGGYAAWQDKAAQ